MRLYSEMPREELVAEVQRLRGEERKKRQAGFASEANVLEQQYYMAKSYLMSLERIAVVAGRPYAVEGIEQPFIPHYREGVMVWGHFASRSEEEVALPLSRLLGLE